jgi:hypothetical protein
MSRKTRLATGLGALALVAGITSPSVASAHDQNDQGENNNGSQHVLLISVDGLHQSDLDWYVAHHPGSTLAQLSHRGTDYTHAMTPVPSDSFPGMVAQATGGNPGTTGVYYDDTFNHALLPAGTTSCAGVAPGTEVTYFEQLDKNPLALDAGQGLAGLPDSILSMTGQPRDVIDPAQLPVDPTTCQPVYPHTYLKVNTVFEVAHQAGLHTAWSDKHPAYEILDGPSGAGIDDLFTPEINSDATGFSGDWTQDNAATQEYDGFKVQSVLNEIDGFDHSRTTREGVPAIFGMNFQTVSTAQKLPTSDGLTGGYQADGVTPGPLLDRALGFVDTQLGSFVAELHRQHLDGDTTIIVSAKHGQSPQDPGALRRVPDSPIIAGLDAAWTAAHPGAPKLVAQATDDDAMLLWLTDRSPEATAFAKQYLLTHSAAANTIDGTATTVNASGLTTVFAGDEAARFFGATPGDPRVPDVFGIVQHGVVYTGGKSKIAEHGGADPQDRNVPILVSSEDVGQQQRVSSPVETTQIAPTILRLLDLNPNALQAVRIEHTRVLPDLG